MNYGHSDTYEYKWDKHEWEVKGYAIIMRNIRESGCDLKEWAKRWNDWNRYGDRNIMSKQPKFERDGMRWSNRVVAIARAKCNWIKIPNISPYRLQSMSMSQNGNIEWLWRVVIEIEMVYQQWDQREKVDYKRAISSSDKGFQRD